MDSFELNKIISAILLVVLFVVGINKIANLVFKVEKPEKAGYMVEVQEKVTKVSTTSEKINLAEFFAVGDIEHGKKVFKKCVSCHSIKSGSGNKIGPALYNVVGREIGSLGDYKYSKAFTDYGNVWSFEELNGFLLKPNAWIKGTKMAYAGLKKQKDRASVILYLNQNSDSPLPLP